MYIGVLASTVILCLAAYAVVQIAYKVFKFFFLIKR